MKFVSVCSGKGGVGKTVLACGAAAILAADGKKVLLFDAHLALPNADLYCGVEPGCTIGHVVRDKREMQDAVVTTPAGFDLISGGSGWPELGLLTREEVSQIADHSKTFGASYDYVIVDLPTGIGPQVQSFINVSDAVMLVTDSSAASLMNAYGFSKIVWEKFPDQFIGLVVNRVSTQSIGADLAGQLKSIVGQFLSKEIRHWATVREDATVRRCSDNREIFAHKSPLSRAGQDLIDAVNAIEGSAEEPQAQVSMLEKLKSSLSPKVEDEAA